MGKVLKPPIILFISIWQSGNRWKSFQLLFSLHKEVQEVSWIEQIEDFYKEHENSCHVAYKIFPLAIYYSIYINELYIFSAAKIIP